MVDSGSGRNDLPELRNSRTEPWPLPESHHGDVRKPGTTLRLVDAELLEAHLQIGRERGRGALRVVQHEHPHAACLAVAVRREPDERSLVHFDVRYFVRIYPRLDNELVVDRK